MLQRLGFVFGGWVASQAGFEPTTGCLEGNWLSALCFRSYTGIEKLSSYRLLKITRISPGLLLKAWVRPSS